MLICSGGDAGIGVANGPDLADGDARPRILIFAFTPYPKTNIFAIISKFADQKGRLVLCFHKQERQA